MLLILFDQTAHSVRWLRALGDPMIDPIQFQRAVMVGFFGSYVPMISMNFPSRGLRLSATTTL